jgi:transcription elongation factor SPT5
MARPCPCKCNIYVYINVYLLLGHEQIGEEQNILVRLLERISPPSPPNTAGQSQQMTSLPQVLSAFVRPSLPGKLYIEAHSEGDVRRSCKGLKGVYLNQLTHIPLEEVFLILQLNVNFFDAGVGTWVRVASGSYRGDLGYVLSSKSTYAKIALIPRIRTDVGISSKRKRSDNERAPQQLFDCQEVVKAYGADSIKKRDACYFFQGDIYKDGFLELAIKLEDLVQDVAIPTVSELFEFSKCPSVDIKNIILPFARNAATSLQRGDRVRIMSGQEAGIIGEICDVEGDVVHILPEGERDHPEMRILVPLINVMKHFKVGDFVEVRVGKEIGKRGWVISCDGPRVTFHVPKSFQDVRSISGLNG